MATACGGGGQAPATDVELDAFSGRPNPRWTITDDGTEFWNRIASLPSAPARQEPGHLGYRGFLLRRGAATARIYKGIVWVHEGDETRTLRDSSGVEATLIDQARVRGFGDLVK